MLWIVQREVWMGTAECSGKHAFQSNKKEKHILNHSTWQFLSETRLLESQGMWFYSKSGEQLQRNNSSFSLSSVFHFLLTKWLNIKNMTDEPAYKRSARRGPWPFLLPSFLCTRPQCWAWMCLKERATEDCKHVRRSHTGLHSAFIPTLSLIFLLHLASLYVSVRGRSGTVQDVGQLCFIRAKWSIANS